MFLQPWKSAGSAQVFWLLFSLTLICMAGMQYTGAELKTDAAPGGIVSFELAGSLAGSQNIMNSWKGTGMTWAGINMGLDFLFLSLYSLTLFVGCLLVADKLPGSYQFFISAGKWLAVSALAAAGLDIVENLSLIALLTGSENEFLPILARWCAIPKFGLVFVAVIYVLGGGSIHLMGRRNR